MINIIEVNSTQNINELNAAAKEALDHPETHGLLVKFYADWCGFCTKMAGDWEKLTNEIKTNYTCKTPGCVLTIANIQIDAMDESDPVISQIKNIPKDLTGVPSIMYVSNGQRGMEFSGDRVYDELLEWIIQHPKFGLVKKGQDDNNNNDNNNNIEPVQYGLDYDVPAHAEPAEPAEPAAHKARNITKRARTKFKLFHRKSLRRFHKLMKKQNKKSVKSRNPTPRRRTKHIPAYLRR
jgi:thiol-disulfide isomerase/thioredoxin